MNAQVRYVSKFGIEENSTNTKQNTLDGLDKGGGGINLSLAFTNKSNIKSQKTRRISYQQSGGTIKRRFFGFPCRKFNP